MSVALTAANSEWLTLDPVVTGPPFTLAGWMRPGPGTAYALISIANELSDVDYFELYWYEVTGAASFNARTVAGSQQAITNNGDSTLNVWKHLCAVAVASDERYCYLNGDTANRGSNMVSRVPLSLTRTGMGALARGSRTHYWNGSMAHLAVWDVALSGNKIERLAHRADPRTVRPDNLVEYHPLIEPPWAYYGRNGELAGRPDSLANVSPVVLPTGYPLQLKDSMLERERPGSQRILAPPAVTEADDRNLLILGVGS